MNPGDKINRMGNILVVVSVGKFPDNKGKLRNGVMAAKQSDLDLEKSGGFCPIWGAPIKFKANVYPYLEGEYTKV